MQERIEQHRAVTGGEQKAVAVRPLRIMGVITHKARPQHVSQRRATERQAGMARLGALYCVNRKRANRVDAKLVEFGRRVRDGRLCGRAHLPCSSFLAWIVSAQTL